MRRLYVDVTTSFQEAGRIAHGTLRVERGIVSAMAAMDPCPATFFRIQRHTGRVALVSRQEAAALSARPARAEQRREMRARPHESRIKRLGRESEAWARAHIRNPLRRYALALTDRLRRPQFAPGSMVLFGGELNTAHLPAFAILRRQIGLTYAFIFYDLIEPLAPDHPLAHDPDATHIPGTEFMLRHGAKLFSISRFSADTLIAHTRQRAVPCPPIEVIRLGHDLQTPGLAKRPPGLAPGRFVLTVGDIVKRKNHALLADVWEALAIRYGGATPPLVVAGRAHRETMQQLHAIQQRLGAHLIVLSNADDDQLAWLYANCRFTVFPSFLEGYGLPVSESLAAGKVCVASSTSAIPEASQGLAIHLDPSDTSGWIAAVEALLDDGVLADRERDLRARYRRVTWADTAGDILTGLRALPD